MLITAAYYLGQQQYALEKRQTIENVQRVVQAFEQSIVQLEASYREPIRQLFLKSISVSKIKANQQVIESTGNDESQRLIVKIESVNGEYYIELDRGELVKLRGSTIEFILIMLLMGILVCLLLYRYLEDKKNKLIKVLTDCMYENLVNDNQRPIELNSNDVTLRSLEKVVNETIDKQQMQTVTISRSFGELNRLSQIFEYSPSLIVTISHDLKISYINKAYKTFLPTHYLEADIISLLPDDIYELVNQSLIENNIIGGVETTINGRIIMWSFIPMPSQTIVNCYGVDVTEIRTAESETESAYMESMIATARSEAKSIFLANMSHEVRTPLTAILGFSETLLVSGQTMEERVVAINTVIRNAKHLLSIINDLLDITKIETGHVVIDKQPMSLLELIDDVVVNYKAECQSSGIDFKFSAEYPLPEYIVSDEVKLKQIVFNLLSNAVKFTKKGYVELAVAYNLEKAQLNIRVKDTGLGIDKEALGIIFNRFEQVDESHARRYGGAGLGLYITQELIDRLGGDMVVNSKKGEGSEFSILMDVECVENTPMINESDLNRMYVPVINEKNKKYKGNVLLVEDNVDNQNLIKMYLQKMGAETDIANNGKEAVAIFDKKQYDLILMDMQMPEMDGVEATKKIRYLDTKTPIVMLTANVLKEDMIECRAVGCSEFLTKPINREKFEKYISKYLEHDTSAENGYEPIVSALVDEGPEFYNIVMEYVKQLPNDFKLILELYENEDTEQLKNKIHAMKGTSGNMGYLDYSDHCAQLEFAITKNDNVEIKRLLAMLEDMKDRIIASID